MERQARVKRMSPLARTLKSQCPNNCGEPGPHYVPPSLGEPGFFVCTPLEGKQPFNDLYKKEIDKTERGGIRHDK